MSTNPPLPFETCPRNDYSQWCEMIDSIVGFVTASTNLASVLKNNNYYIPELLTITDNIKNDQKNEAFDLSDFPWFLQIISPHFENQLSVHEIYEVTPLIEYQNVDVSLGEPNNEPRSVNVINLEGFGDVLSTNSSEESSNNTPSTTTKVIKTDTSSDSCFFNDYSDSEQTIESSNLQENFETHEETPSKEPDATKQCYTLYDMGETETKILSGTKMEEKEKCQKLTCERAKPCCKTINNATKLVCKKYLKKNEDKLPETTATVQELQVCKKKLTERPSDKKRTQVFSSGEKVDFITKNIVNTLNIAKQANLTKNCKIATKTENITSTDKKAKKIFSASMENSIRKAEERMRNAKMKSQPVEQVKLENMGQKTKIPETISAANGVRTPVITERKSCLKNESQRGAKSVKQCIICVKKSSKPFLTRPKTALPRIDERVSAKVPKIDERVSTKVPIIYDNTLKLRAAETVKKADKLLKNAEDKLLTASKTKREMVAKPGKPLIQGRK